MSANSLNFCGHGPQIPNEPKCRTSCKPNETCKYVDGGAPCHWMQARCVANSPDASALAASLPNLCGIGPAIPNVPDCGNSCSATEYCVYQRSGACNWLTPTCVPVASTASHGPKCRIHKLRESALPVVPDCEDRCDTNQTCKYKRRGPCNLLMPTCVDNERYSDMEPTIG